MSKCMYCNSIGGAGSQCHKSPSGGHVKIEPGKCSYCGSIGSPGSQCHKSPSGGHVRGVHT